MDADALEAFRRRDPDAIKAFYREYGNLVYAVAHRVLGQRELAEEATQQTFVRAWQASEKVDPERDPAPWVATIAKNVAIDIYRREARRPAQPVAEIDEGGEALLSSAAPPDEGSLDAAWQVRRAIEELPDAEAAVVRLQHLEGLTHDQIADKLGVPVGTVKSRSFRAHKRLAGLLGHLRRYHDG